MFGAHAEPLSCAGLLQLLSSYLILAPQAPSQPSIQVVEWRGLLPSAYALPPGRLLRQLTKLLLARLAQL
jgi:hypothetical protein